MNSRYSSSALGRRRAKSFRVHRTFLPTLILIVAVLTVISVSSERQLGSTHLIIPVSAKESKVSSDSLWQEVDETTAKNSLKREGGPQAYRTLKLNRARLATILARTPLETSNYASSQQTELALPLADGAYEYFRVVESPIMEPALAARFPEIKTYRGQSVDEPATTTRFDWTPTGFHAIVLSSQGTVLIEPYAPGDFETYVAYFQKDVPISSFGCRVSEEEQETAITQSRKVASSQKLAPEVSSGTTLRTYRLAVAATGEYTQTYGGGTVNGALAAITTTMNIVNAIYEREVAIRLVLIANETSIIFTDPETDGYTSDNVSALISENQTKLDAIISSTNYDIGHVFDGRMAPARLLRISGTSINFKCLPEWCESERGQHYSFSSAFKRHCLYSTAHEMGHQFGASHTFNATTGNCGPQRSPSTAYEPATGSTIMGYRFNCGAEDLMSSDNYFHTASLEQIVNYITIGAGGSCPVLTNTGNNPPTIDAGPVYTIPQGTPFILSALGQDPDGHPLTYSWEQFDLGAASPPNTDDGSRPIFRSFAPSISHARTFPRLFDILNNTASLGESLPVTTRTMNFRVTARDNRSGGGGINSAGTQVNVRADSGPFIVTQPTSGTSWVDGTTQTITWDVANTASPPISCVSVRILMSTNGGLNFNIVLAEDTPNDGSETLTLPVALNTGFSSVARIKVVARENIFFNISRAFTISVPNNSMQFGSSSFSVSESDNPKQINVTVTRNGDTSGAAIANYATIDNAGGSNCNSNSSFASSRCDYEATAGVVRFAPGESSRTISIPIIDDAYQENAESFELVLTQIMGASFGSPSRTVITMTDNDSVTGANPIAQAEFFVRQHYLDFLNREPDASGLAFWTNEITQCGSDAQCVEIKRINVSAAFYLSIEFQETGYFIHRVYKAAYGDGVGHSSIGGSHSLAVPIVLIHEFLPGAQQIGRGVVVNQLGWQQVLESNKQTFLAEFVASSRFISNTLLSPAAFVDRLNSNAGNPLSALERDQLVADFAFGRKTMAQVLRAVAEDPDFIIAEKNRAFVLMQYLGYLRRGPNDFPDGDHTGYDYWLRKLDEFGGNHVNAEMVKAFLNASEYRQRFGP